MSCRTCKGIGWVEVSQDDLRPCKVCNHVHGATKAEIAALVVGFIGLFILMLCWGAQ